MDKGYWPRMEREYTDNTPTVALHSQIVERFMHSYRAVMVWLCHERSLQGEQSVADHPGFLFL